MSIRSSAGARSQQEVVSASPLLYQAPDYSKVAVILNRNARGIHPRVARSIERIVGRQNLFDSRTLEQAESLAREIVQRGYGTVVCAGGDGTFIRSVQLISRYVQEANQWRTERKNRYNEEQSLISMPRFAFLGLGTGNALKNVVGCKNPLQDLERLVSGPMLPTHTIPMVAQDDELFLFGGAGYDSMLLNDYNWLKSHTDHPVIKKLMHSIMGYFAALFWRTIPAIWLGKAPKLHVKITTRTVASYLDPRRGDAAVEVPAGSVLYEGPLTLLGCATEPYFGAGIKIFPFAGVRSDRMHLRLARIGVVSSLMALASVWRGVYRNYDKIKDFLVDDIDIEFSEPFPFEHSGDDQGLVKALHLKLHSEPLKLVDFYSSSLPTST